MRVLDILDGKVFLLVGTDIKRAMLKEIGINLATFQWERKPKYLDTKTKKIITEKQICLKYKGVKNGQ